MSPKPGWLQMFISFGTFWPLIPFAAVSMHTFESDGGNCSIAAGALFWIASRRLPFVAAAPAFGGIGFFASTYAWRIPVAAAPPTPQVPWNVVPFASAVWVSCFAVEIE